MIQRNASIAPFQSFSIVSIVYITGGYSLLTSDTMEKLMLKDVKIRTVFYLCICRLCFQALLL